MIVMYDLIQVINQTPMDQLTTAQLLELRTGGNDQFSNVSFTVLMGLVSEADLTQLQAAFPHNRRSVCNAIRWMLRGLQLDRAIRKAHVDLAVYEPERAPRKDP